MVVLALVIAGAALALTVAVRIALGPVQPDDDDTHLRGWH